MFSSLKIGLVLVMLAGAGGGYLYVNKLQKDNAVLKTNQIKLETAVQESNQVIEQQTKDLKKIRSTLKKVEEVNAKLQADRDALNNRLGSVVNNSLRAVLGRAPLQAVISDRREQLMAEVSGLVAERATQFGISIEEVRIKKADLPSENSEAIYRRMQTERQQEAAQIRAVGEEKSRFIRAEAEKNKTILLAEAQRDGDILRGQGDAEKNKILGKAFSQDPEFFSFYRSMQAYSRALSEGDTTMVLSPKSDFFGVNCSLSNYFVF